MKHKTIIIAIAFLTAGVLRAQTVIGKYGGEFLSFGIGGRALGMGSAQVASVNDVTAGYWNPAGLARINYPQFSLMHEEHFGSLVNFNYAGAAIPYGKNKGSSTFCVDLIEWYQIHIHGKEDAKG